MLLLTALALAITQQLIGGCLTKQEHHAPVLTTIDSEQLQALPPMTFVTVFQTPNLPRQAHANVIRTTSMFPSLILAIYATLVKTESSKELSLINNAFVIMPEDIIRME